MSGSARARKYFNENNDVNVFKEKNGLGDAAYNEAVTRPISTLASISVFVPSSTNSKFGVYAGQEPHVLGVSSAFFKFKEIPELNENNEPKSYGPNNPFGPKYTFGY